MRAGGMRRARPCSTTVALRTSGATTQRASALRLRALRDLPPVESQSAPCDHTHQTGMAWGPAALAAASQYFLAEVRSRSAHDHGSSPRPALAAAMPYSGMCGRSARILGGGMILSGKRESIVARARCPRGPMARHERAHAHPEAVRPLVLGLRHNPREVVAKCKSALRRGQLRLARRRAAGNER